MLKALLHKQMLEVRRMYFYNKRKGTIVTKKSNGKPDLNDPHFDRKSQIILGKRYADKVLKMCYKK